MKEEVKGKVGMVLEYVIRDKYGNIKEQGTEEINKGGKK